MSKRVVALLIALLMFASFAACGGDSGSKNEESVKDERPEDITGTVYDAGCVSAIVPDGWMAAPVADIFEEYDGDNDPYGMYLYKGAEDEYDIFTKPYISITWYGEESYAYSQSFAKDFYTEVEDLEPMTLGDYTWSAFTGKNSLGDLFAVMWVENDEGYSLCDVLIYCEADDGSISVDDADVQAIIASITPTGTV